jgi:methanethiol S-methyltransferase
VDPQPSAFARLFALVGALVFVASLLFFVWSYAVGFDDLAPAAATSGWTAVAVDVALFSIFALHHSVFARTGIKQWTRRTLSPTLERSFYVWIASLIFVGTCVWWQAVPGVFWNVDGTMFWILSAVQLAGVIGALAAARRLDVFDLAGVRQVFAPQSIANRHPDLDDRGPYGIVRHPIYSAWLVMVWLTPRMTGTRLVFAAISTLYLIVAIPFEERDLRRTFGAQYDDYKRRVRWRMVPGLY